MDGDNTQSLSTSAETSSEVPAATTDATTTTTDAAAACASSAPLDKIRVLLKPVGDAPILKQRVWLIGADKEVADVIKFVSGYLKLEKGNSLFLFVNQAFAPSPDQLVRNLYECFGADGKLVLHYSKAVAWG